MLKTASAASTRWLGAVRYCNSIQCPADNPFNNRSNHTLQSLQLTPVSTTHLDSYYRSPTLKRILASAKFLRKELPTRLELHLGRLNALNCRNEGLKTALKDAVRRKEVILAAFNHHAPSIRHMSHPPMAEHAAEALLTEFHTSLATFTHSLEGELEHICFDLRNITETQDWWNQGYQVQALNRAMDLAQWWIMSVRVMAAQHLAGWHARVSPPLERRKHPSLIYSNGEVVPLVRLIAEDCRALCVEKNSVAPVVDVVGGEGLRANLVDSYFQFVMVELLKNSMQALIDRHGAWDVDEADPIKVHVSDLPDGTFQLVVTDKGGGMTPTKLANMFNYFYTGSSTALRDPTYGYSRDHGAKMHGNGVGVPLSRVYAHFMGGSITWSSNTDEGVTSAVLTLPKGGFSF